MLKVTFYSYKGGVGRTLAMLNVAALLAEHGRRVLVVDLDLEAPGLGFSALTSPDARVTDRLHEGVSDLLLNREASGTTPLSTYVYPAMEERFEDRFQVMTAGSRAGELSGKIEALFRDPQGDRAHLFMLMLAEIEAFVDPDYVFFDSPTGLADAAGVCTMELPDVLVAFCGLGEQHVGGMDGALARVRGYWKAAERDVATLLVLSPVPREVDLQPSLGTVDTMQDLLLEHRERPSALADAIARHPLAARVHEAQARLLAPLKEGLARLQPRFPSLEEADLLHVLEYEPRLALEDVLVRETRSTLARQYERLARSIARAASDHPFGRSEMLAPPPIFV